MAQFMSFMSIIPDHLRIDGRISCRRSMDEGIVHSNCIIFHDSKITADKAKLDGNHVGR
jgi:hypothetical protein